MGVLSKICPSLQKSKHCQILLTQLPKYFSNHPLPVTPLPLPWFCPSITDVSNAYNNTEFAHLGFKCSLHPQPTPLIPKSSQTRSNLLLCSARVSVTPPTSTWLPKPGTCSHAQLPFLPSPTHCRSFYITYLVIPENGPLPFILFILVATTLVQATTHLIWAISAAPSYWSPCLLPRPG